MANARAPRSTAPNEDDAWREHNLSQLRYFRSLSLREKLLSLEGMAEIVRLLEVARARDRESSGGKLERR